ncbi:hypothetical protein C8R46DRAFT_1158059 [Mycena filopes]|nr:hypothetical protein C8R46DRAFT_1158059 [Mycena filopes]
MTTTTAPPPFCKDCFTGVKHSGEPVGKTITIADIPTYISEPPAGSPEAGPKKIILFFSDVFGPFFLNNKLLQDFFASQGGVDIQMRDQALEVTPKWLAEVRKQYGYCFGGPFVMDLGATDDIVAAAFAHPGFVTEEHFKKIKQPLLMSCAESDYTFSLELRRRAEDILVENKAKYQFQIFSGVQHGFASRGNPDIPDIRARSPRAGIIGWFSRFSA